MSFYKGTGKKLTTAEFNALAKEYGLEPAVLKAITVVEARASGFYADGTVICLYEPHIAFQQSSGAVQAALVKAGLAYKNWVSGNYPKTSFARIDKCAQIAGEEVAAKSTSWGLGQIMGFNHKRAGYATAVAMVKDFAQSEYNQLKGMLNFIKGSSTMMNAAKKRDWATFARLYNGPGYKTNKYDTKLANAYAAAVRGSKAASTVIVDGTIGRGDKGPKVKAVQEKLNALGFFLENIDSDFGRLTEDAVRKFEKAQGLKADGRLDLKEQAILNDLFKQHQAKEVKKAKAAKPAPVAPPKKPEPVKPEPAKPAEPIKTPIPSVTDKLITAEDKIKKELEAKQETLKKQTENLKKKVKPSPWAAIVHLLSLIFKPFLLKKKK